MHGPSSGRPGRLHWLSKRKRPGRWPRGKPSGYNCAMSKALSKLSAVPLFPLPNIVLFPRAVLPLHIFEERYKAMMADALATDKLIAMALLKSGWEKNYHDKPAIEPIVCIGEVLTWEKLDDGKYNLLLQGRMRARIVKELVHHPYRVAELERLQEEHAMEIDLEDQRGRLLQLFSGGALGTLPVGRQFQELLAGPLPTPDIADLLAFNFLEDVQFKQNLLGEVNVRRRVRQVVAAIQEYSTHINPAMYGFPTDPSVN